MSAAATAAGYLYASGRLRGRGKEGGGDPRKPEPEQPERKRVKVAALPERPVEAPAESPQRPRRTPTVQYRKPRWRPDGP